MSNKSLSCVFVIYTNIVFFNDGKPVKISNNTYNSTTIIDEKTTYLISNIPTLNYFSDEKIEYDKYYLDSDNKRQHAPDAELVFNTNYSSDNYTVNLGNKSINPNLNPISVYSSILIKNFTNVDHVKISIIDVTHDKLLFQTLKPFNITNQYLVDDDINRIVSNSSLIESEFSLDLDVKKNFNNFKKLDSDDNDLITFNDSFPKSPFFFLQQ